MLKSLHCKIHEIRQSWRITRKPSRIPRWAISAIPSLGCVLIHVDSLWSLHKTFPDCGNHMESRRKGQWLSGGALNSLMAIPCAGEPGSDPWGEIPTWEREGGSRGSWRCCGFPKCHCCSGRNTPLILLVLSRGWGMDGNGMIVHRC